MTNLNSPKPDREREQKERDEERSLARREVYPPEEFAGFGDAGEFPELRPGEKSPVEKEKTGDDAGTGHP